MNAKSLMVVVAQKGARRHYLVARALHARGMLARLVTDWYSPALDGRMKQFLSRLGGRAARRALARRAEGLADEFVQSSGLRALAWDLIRRACDVRWGPCAGNLVTNRAFASRVVRLPLPPHDVFFGFSYASLEALRAEKERGVFTILDQFDAGELHYRLARQEAEKWPDYATATALVGDSHNAHFDRVRQEWDAADLVIANSEWTRRALLDEGVPAHKIEVNPLAYEPDRSAAVTGRRRLPPPPLQVLWIGTVNVAKGIQYLVEAARALKGKPVQFTVAGPLRIKAAAVTAAPRNIRWLGQIPRPEVSALYQEGHVFVLPTISDGFAITQLEALAHGLPVIVTPNCGRVVEEGKTGFVIPPFSSDALGEAILRFLEEPTLLDQMSPRCVQAAGEYSVDTYASRLVSIIESRASGNLVTS